MLGIKRIRDNAFQRLIVRWQRAVFQSAGNPNPSHAVRMHDEWLVTGNCIIAFRAFLWPIVWRLLLCEVRSVVACPFLLFGVPPHQRFALAPWLSIRTRRSTVVQNPAITWPCISPSVPVAAFGFAIARLVFVGRRHHAGINPAAAGRGTIILKLFVA